MRKICKIGMSIILSLSIFTYIFPISNVQANELPVPTNVGNPYPEHTWINLGTITLDKVTINNAISVRNVLLSAIGGIVGGVFGATSGTVVASVTAAVNRGEKDFYIRLTQYVSTDYQWHYYSYTVYSDAKCTKKIASYISTKWKDRYTRKLMEQMLLIS